MTDLPSTGASSPDPASSPDADAPPPLVANMRPLADHWGLLLGYGLLTVGMGVVLVVWPESTLVVLAVLLAIQLIFAGTFRLVSAVATSSLDGGMRALLGLTGALGILVGLLCLRSPLQTLVVIGMLIGIYWVVSGLVDIINALRSAQEGRRGWDLLLGLLSLVAGVFLIVNPEISLAALVIVSSVWLFGFGFIAIVAAVRLRGSTKHPATSTPPTALPA